MPSGEPQRWYCCSTKRCLTRCEVEVQPPGQAFRDVVTLWWQVTDSRSSHSITINFSRCIVMLPLTFKLNFTVLVIPNFGRIKGLRWCCRELRSSQLDLAFFETPIGSSWVEANLLSPQLGSLDASLMENSRHGKSSKKRKISTPLIRNYQLFSIGYAINNLKP